MSRHPLFIVGSPRSGTSILRRAIGSAGYHGFAEGNFLTLIRALDIAVDRHWDIFANDKKRVLVTVVDREKLKDDLARLVAATAEALQPGVPWLDKTGNPEMIEVIPTLRRIWPDSHFILAKRRAIENIVSRMKKFPRHSFAYHCTNWARNMAAWRELRAAEPALPAIEVDQRDISAQPAETAARIAAFLDIGPEGMENIRRTFVHDRPQETEPGSADRVLSLATTGWSAEQIGTFHLHCDHEMACHGYSFDETYRAAPPP